MEIFSSALSFKLLVGVLLGAIGFYWYMKRNFNYWKKQGVKGEPPIFFFGNVASCVLGKQNPQGLIKELYKQGEDEDMFGFYAFNTPYLIMRNPELIKNVFIKDFNYFTTRLMCGKHRDSFAVYDIAHASNPTWKILRKKLSPIFTPGKLRNIFDLNLEIIESFHEYMDKLKIDVEEVGKPVNVKKTCTALMAENITSIAFGFKLNSHENIQDEFISHGENTFRTNYIRYLDLLAILFLPMMRPFLRPKFFEEEQSEMMRKSFWGSINERTKSGISRSDVIDHLIKIINHQKNNPTEELKLEGDALVAQSAVFFTAGLDSSSTITTFALYELAKRTDLQSRLRDEILEGIKSNDGKITYDMVNTLPYLHMVVSEAMRMHPVLPWLDRVADSDYVVPGTKVVVKKGSAVILPMSAIHMDPRYFPDPEKFDPERFSDANRNQIVPYTFFPFGLGPRGCMGTQMGYIQVKLGVLYFISNYVVTPCEKTPETIEYETMNVLLQMKEELFLNFKKIN